MFNPEQKAEAMKKLTSVKRKNIIKELAWSYFSLYIRIRDGWKCVLADSSCWGAMQAGHVIGRGKHVSTYDEDNVHCQCQSHNSQHRFNPQIYYNWFIRKYGQDKFLAMTDPAYLNQVYKIDHDSIMETYRCKLLGIIDEQPEHAKEKFETLNKKYKKL